MSKDLLYNMIYNNKKNKNFITNTDLHSLVTSNLCGSIYNDDTIKNVPFYTLKNINPKEYISKLRKTLRKFKKIYSDFKGMQATDLNAINLNQLSITHPQSNIVKTLTEMFDYFDGSNSYSNIGYIDLIYNYLNGIKNVDEIIINSKNILGANATVDSAIYFLNNVYNYLLTVKIENDEPDFDEFNNPITKILTKDFLEELKYNVNLLINILKEVQILDNNKALDGELYPETYINNSSLQKFINNSKYIDDALIRCYNSLVNKVEYTKNDNTIYGKDQYIAQWKNEQKKARSLKRRKASTLNIKQEESENVINHIETDTFDELISTFMEYIDEALSNLEYEICSYSRSAKIIECRDILKNQLIKFYKKYQIEKNDIKFKDETEKKMLMNFENYLNEAIKNCYIKIIKTKTGNTKFRDVFEYSIS